MYIGLFFVMSQSKQGLLHYAGEDKANQYLLNVRKELITDDLSCMCESQ